MKYIDDYVDRKHGRSWSTPHPTMTEFLLQEIAIGNHGLEIGIHPRLRLV